LRKSSKGHLSKRRDSRDLKNYSEKKNSGWSGTRELVDKGCSRLEGEKTRESMGMKTGNHSSRVISKSWGLAKYGKVGRVGVNIAPKEREVASCRGSSKQVRRKRKGGEHFTMNLSLFEEKKREGGKTRRSSKKFHNVVSVIKIISMGTKKERKLRAEKDKCGIQGLWGLPTTYRKLGVYRNCGKKKQTEENFCFWGPGLEFRSFLDQQSIILVSL